MRSSIAVTPTPALPTEVRDVAGELSTEARGAVRDLILVMADSKRLLGMRYAGWILGAPELEAGIACASMAQDEWGHGRLLYALLKDFDEDVDRLEHGREPAEYASMEVLDSSPQSWHELVACNTLVDGALSVQLEAFGDSTYPMLRQRVEKMLDEERFHAAHGAAWVRRLAAGGDESRSAMKTAIERIGPAVFRWFGPDSERSTMLVESGVAGAAGSELRLRLADRIETLLIDAFGEMPVNSADPTFDGFDEATRRTLPDGPDEATIRQVRGDKNRVFLMD
jgi:ring-1,2-phenylacetyl-CoA epoxidase subunit PaaC